MTRSHIVIPARLNSTRLPRKLLLRARGKSILQHTFEAARRARRPEGVSVATDHEMLAREARRFGAPVFMTSPSAPSGTDRVAEVAAQLKNVDVIVNVQADEPELSPDAIDLAIQLLECHPGTMMATLATPIRSLELLHDPACVKVVADDRGQALYFSRSPVPFARDGVADLLQREPPIYLQHLGLYAYRREFLLELTGLPRSPLEDIEKLEQLRVLAAGHSIQLGVVDEATSGIDTPADYDAFLLRQAG